MMMRGHEMRDDGQENGRKMLKALARKARREQTPAEARLRELLRDHCCGGLHFRSQKITRPFGLAGILQAVQAPVASAPVPMASSSPLAHSMGESGAVAPGSVRSTRGGGLALQ